MDTKLKADIAECAVATELLKRGHSVLKPIGDRLPYDLAIDLKGRLVKIQVKSAWFYKDSYKVDSRITKTNRRKMLRKKYNLKDFDFAVIYIEKLNIFYIIPSNVFFSYKSEITLVEKEKRQRKPRSCFYRERWDLLNPISS